MVVAILAFIFVVVAVFAFSKIIKKMNEEALKPLQIVQNNQIKDKTLADEFKEFQELKKLAKSDDDLREFLELKKACNREKKQKVDKNNTNRNSGYFEPEFESLPSLELKGIGAGWHMDDL